MKSLRFACVACALSGAITAQAQSNYEPYYFDTLAGLAGSVGSSDGIGSAARFGSPTHVAVDSAGNVYVADQNNHTIRKVTPAGVVTTLAGLAGNPGSADGTGSGARFYSPTGVAVDSAGNVYVADRLNDTIRKITAAAVVTTLAGLAGSPGSANGTGSAARFISPTQVAVDSAGNVYVADQNNHTIRKITPAAVVTTLAGLAGNPGSADGTGSAAQFGAPRGVAVDSAGNVYVADTLNHTIRKITPTAVVTTLAGLAGNPGSADGTGSVARFNFPKGVAVDNASNLYVADGHAIRKITPAAVVTTLAGLAGTNGSADGTGSAARFFNPFGVAVDSVGKVYVGDFDNRTIRLGGPPVIGSPLVASGIVGQAFVYQFESNGATSLGVTGLPSGLTFNSGLSAIIGIPTAAGTFPVGLSASNAAGTTNATLTLTVQAPPSGPVIISSTCATGRTGRAFSFLLQTIGGGSATNYTVDALPPGLSLDPRTGFISGTPTSDGSFSLAVSAIDGAAITHATVQLTFTSDTAVPIISSAGSALLTPGQFFSYTITADANGTFGYIGTDGLVHQGPSSAGLPAGLSFDGMNTISGIFNGGPITGGKTETAERNAGGGPGRIPDQTGGVITNVQLFVTGPNGTSIIPFISFIMARDAVNISTRLEVGTGDNVLIGGFIINGTGTTKALIRAIGPSLKDFGIANFLADPTLELRDGAGTLLGSNNDWRDSQESAIVAATYPPSLLAPRAYKEAAILAFLSPGSYTATLSGKNKTTGIALVEVYDLGVYPHSSDDARLANISTRGLVGTGDSAVIGGFIVHPQAPATTTRVVIRGIGPSLEMFVTIPLADPTLELLDGSNSLITMNNDWQDNAMQATEITATGLAPTEKLESAIIVNLNPGNYTAIVRGKGVTTGVALVEVYALEK